MLKRAMRTLEQRLQDLQNELEQEVAKLKSEFDPQTIELERLAVKPRKADTKVTTVALVWAAEG